MRAGDVIGDRFEVEHLADSGGMGAVYRARDRQTGALCALKTLFGQRDEDLVRFAREAELLAELQHPGIVRYVDHGSTDGVRWLALEWLSGVDLAERLSRFGRLSVDEALLLTRQVAGALAATHTRGIVHRDIKPRNLFLVDNDVERVKVLDFGVARVDSVVPRPVGTHPDSVVGTPGYMAPEQARGERVVDGSADVFSLGCVLFECLTGEPAFSGEEVMSLLAKILLEEVPRVRSLRPEVPASLDALVARMLCKDPEQRPRDGVQMLEDLGRIATSSSRSDRPPPAPLPMRLTRREQRLMCVIAARDGDPGAHDLEQHAPPHEPDDAVREAARPFGARVERLADRSLVLALEGRGGATDLVARAARCALAIRPLLGGAAVSMATGRGELDARIPAGEAIERAVRSLRADAPGAAIRVDEVTAGLLDGRFEVSGDAGGLSLLRELDVEPGVRTLLGKPTPCVGRTLELSTLESLYQECAAAPRPLAVLITGPPGAGKSRLLHELLRRLRAPAGHGTAGEAAPEVWIARGDPIRAGSPLGLIAQALRGAAGLLDGEPARVRASKLRARVARHVAAEEVTRVAEFLGEFCGAAVTDAASVQLRAARLDPQLMGDQIRRAWEDFLAAECGEGPLLLVLDDLHWGDLPSVKLVDSALAWLDGRPLMVLALARPEVGDQFPRLWAERSLTRMSLAELPRKAGEKLVRHVLDERATPEVVTKLVERSAGNAFYLEELIRAVAKAPAGRVAEAADALPETVLAMVQARLEALDADARQVLRAASVFGRVFWARGVMALLGDVGAERAVLAQLSALREDEHLTRSRKAKFPGEEELLFRHELVREAAYAALTDADRAVGHRLAAAWLERAGESDPMVLAEHFERGGEPERAVAWYRHAAELALDSSDFASAIDRAERGVACGAQGDARAALRLVAAQAHGWAGDLARDEACALEAMELATEGSALWCDAAGLAAMASGRLGHTDRLLQVAEEVLAVCSRGPVEAAQVIAATRAAMRLFMAARHELAERLMDQVHAAAAELADRDPTVASRLHRVNAWRASFAGDTAEAMKRTEAAAIALEQIGNLRDLCSTRANLGDACADMGRWALAELTLRAALSSAARLRLPSTAALARHNLGRVLAQRGKLEEARAVEVAAVEVYEALGNRRMEGGSRIYLASIEQLGGDLAAAEREARRAVETLAAAPAVRCYALGTLASVLLASGRAGEAAVTAAEAMRLMDELGAIDAGESLVRLVHAEALAATGDRAAARRAIAAARQRLLSRAARIRDSESRDGFLTHVPENARTLALADAWGAD